MQKLRTSSTLNLHYHSRDNVSEYIKAGLAFQKEAGFDAADLNTCLLDISSDGWKEQVEKATADSKELGIAFEVCHLPFTVGDHSKDTDFMAVFDKRMHNAIDAAALLGAKFAVCHPNTSTLPMKLFNRTGQYDTVMKHLSPYVEHAQKVGLNIVVENMRIIPGMRYSYRYCQTPEDLCDVADALGVGVCWDFGHANISGLRQSEALAYVGKRLKVIHVNDNSGIDDDHVAPFTGNIDWRDAMLGLKIAEFDGLFNYEVSTGRIPEAARASFAAYLIDVAHELIAYI